VAILWPGLCREGEADGNFDVGGCGDALVASGGEKPLADGAEGSLVEEGEAAGAGDFGMGDMAGGADVRGDDDYALLAHGAGVGGIGWVGIVEVLDASVAGVA